MGEARDWIPLRPNWLQILLSLSAGPAHGYAIMQEVEERTAGSVKLWPANLYTTVKKIVDEGLIEPVEVDEGDQRRQHYALTRLGRSVLALEVERLDQLVQLARERGAGAEVTG